MPHLVRYQGQASDSQGVPLEGPYTMTFRMYDAETAGTKIWEEVQSGVTISKGNFSVLLGQVTSLNPDWSTPCWLSIQVGTESELSPRQRITSVPLAIRAETAEQLAGGSDSVRVRHSLAISVPDSTSVFLPFDTVRWDTNELHSTTAPSRLVAKTAGKYYIFGHVGFNPNATGYRMVCIYVNHGVSLPACDMRMGASGGATYVSIATVFDLRANDYVEFAAMQNSGGALSITQDATGYSPEFGMVKAQ